MAHPNQPAERKQSAMPPYPDADPKWNDLTSFFTQLGKAVSSGDGKAAADLWAVPAFVVGDEQSMAISSMDEIEQFFSSGRAVYNAAGIEEAVADIQNVRWLTPKMVLCEVCWPYVNTRGENIGEETSTYLLRRDERGSYEVQAAVMHGGTELESGG